MQHPLYQKRKDKNAMSRQQSQKERQQQQARQEHTDQMYHTSRVSSGPLSYASILKSGNVPAQHRLHDFQAN